MKSFKFSKAVAGGLGSILGTIASGLLMKYVPGIDSALVGTLVAGAVTSATVYVAPPNAPN